MRQGRLGPLWTFLFRYGPPRWTEYVLKNWSGQRLVIAVPYLWLLIFFLVPFLIVLKISFAEFSPLGRPPYEPVFQWLDEGALQIKLLIGSYLYLLNEPLYVELVAVFAQGGVLLHGLLPAAGLPDGLRHRARPAYLPQRVPDAGDPAVLDFVPAARLCVDRPPQERRRDQQRAAWRLGIIDEPLTMMNTSFAVYIGIVYSYLPFMILPLYSNLEKHDLTLLEAASDLGAGPIRAFMRITLPLSMPGRHGRLAAGVHPGGG